MTYNAASSVGEELTLDKLRESLHQLGLIPKPITLWVRESEWSDFRTELYRLYGSAPVPPDSMLLSGGIRNIYGHAIKQWTATSGDPKSGDLLYSFGSWLKLGPDWDTHMAALRGRR